MNKIVKISAALGLMVGILLPTLTLFTSFNSLPALAAGGGTSMTLEDGLSSSRGEGVPEELVGTGGMFEVIVNILLFLIGAVSVIMLIYGGIRYTTSGGNAKSVESAKNTIMYSIIGLIVAILAYAIIQFVVTQLLNQ